LPIFWSCQRQRKKKFFSIGTLVALNPLQMDDTEDLGL
jgi:hypothetical protein